MWCGVIGAGERICSRNIHRRTARIESVYQLRGKESLFVRKTWSLNRRNHSNCVLGYIWPWISIDEIVISATNIFHLNNYSFRVQDYDRILGTSEHIQWEICNRIMNKIGAFCHQKTIDGKWNATKCLDSIITGQCSSTHRKSYLRSSKSELIYGTTICVSVSTELNHKIISFYGNLSNSLKWLNELPTGESTAWMRMCTCVWLCAVSV